MIKYSDSVKFNDLDKKLQTLLYIFDKAIPIDIIATSGRRSIEKNKEVRGVANSSHLTGLALDLACTDSTTRYTITYFAYIAGFKRIGLAKDHVHLDADDTKAQNILFFDGF